MSKWQDNFSEYTTSVAFSIQLSRAQVSALEAIEDYRHPKGFHMFYASAQALIRRGLAEHNDVEGKRDWIFRLTPAGKAVLELCRMSGAVSERSPAANAA